MLSFHAQLKVFVATAPCDLQLSFNGLWAAAEQQLTPGDQTGLLACPVLHRAATPGCHVCPTQSHSVPKELRLGIAATVRRVVRFHFQ